VIIEDNVVASAIMSTGRPWVRLLSCNPAELKDAAVAPFSSGYAAADRSRGRRSSTRCGGRTASRDRLHACRYAELAA
jgi:hypothetical protein